jgi:hypothetical protein
MLPLIGGLIILVILLLIVWIYSAPLFINIGNYVSKKMKPFKNQGEEKSNEQI